MFKLFDGRDKFYQWDKDRVLIIEDETIKEVHFCNRTDDCSLVVETIFEPELGQTLAPVPNILLTTDWRINVYGYAKDLSGNYTKHSKVFEVVSRTKPSDYVYTETEIRDYNTLKADIENCEDRVNTLFQEIDIVANSVNDVSKEVDEVKAEAQSLEFAVGDLQMATSGFYSEIQSLGDKVDTLEGSVSAQGVHIENINAAVTKLENKDKYYEFIEEFTLEEAVMSINRDYYPNLYSKMYVSATFAVSPVGTTFNQINFGFYNLKASIGSTAGIGSHTSNIQYPWVECRCENGRWITEWVNGTSKWGNGTNQYANINTRMICDDANKQQPITRVQVSSTVTDVPIPAGSTFKIYGVRV